VGLLLVDAMLAKVPLTVLSFGEMRNDVHYTKDGYVILGRRFARQAHALVTGKEPAADGRP